MRVKVGRRGTLFLFKYTRVVWNKSNEYFGIKAGNQDVTKKDDIK